MLTKVLSLSLHYCHLTYFSSNLWHSSVSLSPPKAEFLMSCIATKSPQKYLNIQMRVTRLQFSLQNLIKISNKYQLLYLHKWKDWDHWQCMLDFIWWFVDVISTQGAMRINTTCCLFLPVNWCFACCLLIKIYNTYSILKIIGKMCLNKKHFALPSLYLQTKSKGSNKIK